MANNKWSAWTLAILAVAPGAAQAPPETVLFNFAALPNGEHPYAGVVGDAEGNLYGTACNGGASSSGVVYKVDTAGVETVLYNFAGGSAGGCPQAGVILDDAGNLYGTTEMGGAADSGVVYTVNAAGQETVLYSFSGGADGQYPRAGVVRDAAGNLYGTTELGGLGNGVVFKLDTAGHETVLYSFAGGTDGARPFTGVTLDAAGDIYGTAAYGGSSLPNCSHPPSGCGVVFKIGVTDGNYRVLHTFQGERDGSEPFSSVLLDYAGNLYGATWAGGTANWGVVYRLNTTGPVHETVLYNFTGGDDGGNPDGPLTLDAEGNLYGTTEYGGTTNCGYGCGVVYRLDASGHENTLYAFTGGTDGANPVGGVIRDASGNLYGTTQGGGPAKLGALFKVDPSGHETVLDAFTGGVSGYSPQSAVIRDEAGNFYGTTYYGGLKNDGVMYKINETGNETVLFSFTGGDNGANPSGSIARDAAGNTYGTTSGEADGNAKVVYKVDPAGQETVLANFARSDGVVSGVVIDAAGNLFGTATSGGAGSGVVYKIDAKSGYTVLYSFTGGVDGEYPWGVVLDSAGNIYGTTSQGGVAGFGIVYKLSPAGEETVLYNFTGASDGGLPYAGVILDAAGNLYGTASAGGTAGFGTVFKLDAAGQETVLYNFTQNWPHGPTPYSSLAVDASGNLYGTTYAGGTGCGYYGCGTVYEVNSSGKYTRLHSFTGGTDGANPSAPVYFDSAGLLFGTASAGGERRGGILFKLLL